MKQHSEEDLRLLSAAAKHCRENFSGNNAAKEFLSANEITDEAVWSAFRLGIGNEAFPKRLSIAEQQRLHELNLLKWNRCFNLGGVGVVMPTFDPRQPDQPVGFIKITPAQNKHGFITEAKGIGCTAAVNDAARIVLTDSPLLAVRLAQAGAREVVIIETPEVVPPLLDWFKGKELVATAYKKGGLKALKDAFAPLPITLAQIQPEIWRSARTSLQALGINKEVLRKPEPARAISGDLLFSEVLHWAANVQGFCSSFKEDTDMKIDNLNQHSQQIVPLLEPEPEFIAALPRLLPGWPQPPSPRMSYVGDEGLHWRGCWPEIFLTMDSNTEEGTFPEPLFEPERITGAQQVWSRVYGRHVSEQEAIEILLSVRHFAKVMDERVRQS